MKQEFIYLRQQLSALNKTQKYLIVLIICIFLNMFLTGIYLIFLVIKFIKNNELSNSIKNIKTSKYLIIFGIIALINSAIHQNIFGVLSSIELLLAFSIMFVYRNHVDKNFFYLVIKLSALMSLFSFGIALFQFVQINLVLDSPNIFLIQDKPEYRVHGVFFNANYYATILEFVILMSFYKLALVRDKESSTAFYFLVIFLNIFALYLTGCRTAWFAIFMAIPIMFLFQKKYYIGLLLIILSFITLFLTFSLELFPRIDTLLKDFSIRLDIWSTAFKGFLANPLFGIGPFGYRTIYSTFGGPKTVHAHSIYFDSLLSFGLVGVSLALIYLQDYIRLFLRSSHKTSYSFIIGIIIVVLVHGIFDVAIFQIQTTLLFLILVSSISMHGKE